MAIKNKKRSNVANLLNKTSKISLGYIVKQKVT